MSVVVPSLVQQMEPKSNIRVHTPSSFFPILIIASLLLSGSRPPPTPPPPLPDPQDGKNVSWRSFWAQVDYSWRIPPVLPWQHYCRPPHRLTLLYRPLLVGCVLAETDGTGNVKQQQLGNEQRLNVMTPPASCSRRRTSARHASVAVTST